MDMVGASFLTARTKAGLKTNEVDGTPYCEKCGEPLTQQLHLSGFAAEHFGTEHTVPRNCSCMTAYWAAYDAKEEQRKREAARETARYYGLAEAKYRASRLEMDDGRDPKTRDVLDKLLTRWGDVIDGNYGVGLIGPNGTGKTFYAAALANALIDRDVSVYMATSSSLIKDMDDAYDDVMREVRTVKTLIIDDLGAERATSYVSERLFMLVDTRYNAQLPLVFTANLTKDAFLNPSSIEQARIYSKLREMCPAVMEVTGERRTEIAERKRRELRELIRGVTND